MQRKQEAAIKRRTESMDNLAPRQRPPLVARVDVSGSAEGMGVICHPEDWNRMLKVRTEPRKAGS